MSEVSARVAWGWSACIHGCLLIEPDFKPGDPPPSGYNNWHAWARVQDRAGLKQRRCWKCGLWRFPQEACCGLEPPDLHHAAFTVDDVLNGKAPWPAGIPRKRKATATQRLVQIDATLARIPTFACKPGCSACCGPVLMSRLEWKRICVRLGYDTNTPQPAETVLANLIDASYMVCPMLKDGRCSVYDIRPAICRLFGAAADKMLECPKGCRPETYMDGAAAGTMLRDVGRLGL